MEQTRTNCGCPNCKCSPNICNCSGACGGQQCCEDCGCKSTHYHQHATDSSIHQVEEDLRTATKDDPGTIQERPGSHPEVHM